MLSYWDMEEGGTGLDWIVRQEIGDRGRRKERTKNFINVTRVSRD